MSVWRFETAPLSAEDKRIEVLFHVFFGDLVSGVGNHFGKTFALYRFLRAHRGEPNLQRRVLRNGKPLFTPAEMRKVLRGLGVQRGGASAGTGMYNKIINKFGSFFSGSSTGAGGLPGLPAFEIPCTKSLRECLFKFPSLPYLKEVSGFFEKALFLLHTLETEIPVLGPLVVSPALDSATLGLPAAEGFIESGLHMAAVVPVVGSFAVLAATVIGPVIAVLTTLMNLSRKQFGSAFQTSLAIVPSFGDALMEASQQAETFLKRLQERFRKVIDPVQEISPTAGFAAQKYVPSLDTYTGPDVPLTMETVNKIKGEVIATLEKKAKDDPRITKALETVRTFADKIGTILPPTIMAKVSAGDLTGAAQEVVAMTQKPPEEILQALGVPPEAKAFVNKAVKTAGNLKNAAVALVSSAGTLPSLPSLPSLPTLPSLPSLPTLPSLPSVPAPAAPAPNNAPAAPAAPAVPAPTNPNVKTRRRSRRWLRRNTRKSRNPRR